MSLRPRVLLTLAVVLLSTQELPAAPPPIELRLGVVSWDVSANRAGAYHKLIDRLNCKARRPFRARIAPGTYGEVLHWLDRGLLDVAVLTPALYAETLKRPAPGTAAAHAPCLYLATEWSPWAGDSYRSRPVCLVRKGSGLNTFAALNRAAAQNRVRFLLVDWVSASGHLAQRAALEKAGLTLKADQIEFTYSHTGSLARLANAVGKDGALAAFVFEGAARLDGKEGDARFERVKGIPGLDTDEYAIPQNVWVARPGFAHVAALRELLASHDKRAFATDREELDRPLYLRVGAWADALGAWADRPAKLDEIGWLLRHYEREHGSRKARLAVVLSGGGAKCSYQVGALQEIERKLGDDISLVAGTSGGALNAIPVAMGITNEEPEALADEWLQLDLGDVADLARPITVLLAVWVACLVVVLLEAVRIGRAGWSLSWKHRLWAAPLLLATAAALVFFVLPWLPVLRSRGLGQWEWVDRLVWLRYPQVLLLVGWGRWVPLLAGVVWLATLSRPGGSRFLSAAATRAVLVAAVLVLPVLTLAAQLLQVETLFTEAGITRVLDRRYTQLTRGYLDNPGPEVSNRLAHLSEQTVKQIAAGGHPRRDLVVTGSCLPPRPDGLDSDLYFFLPAGKGRAAPRFGTRGHSLLRHPHILLEVVKGSGAIYPAFGASTVNNFPGPGESVKIIDGGFAHNSPVEAAVQWGATHILLLEASPRSEKEKDRQQAHAAPPRHGLLYNLGDAFNHLYDQSQLLDVRSREKVAIFTLRPKKWHLTVIDFSRGLIRDAIEAGKADAAGANFKRQYGEPRFLETPDADL